MLLNQFFHPLDKFFSRARADSIQRVDDGQEFSKFLAITVVICDEFFAINGFSSQQRFGVVGENVFQRLWLRLHSTDPG